MARTDPRHWWNGRWGRLAGRRDIFLRPSEGGFVVEARQGGKDGVAQESDPLPMQEAYDLVRYYMGDGGEWRELSATPPPDD